METYIDVSGTQRAQSIALGLIREDRSFRFDPLPDDRYRFTFKREHRARVRELATTSR